jgi:hypothetical protein
MLTNKLGSLILVEGIQVGNGRGVSSGFQCQSCGDVTRQLALLFIGATLYKYNPEVLGDLMRNGIFSLFF